MERVRRRDPPSAAALARLAFALLASLALHTLLVVRVGQGPERPPSSPVIRARLAPPSVEPGSPAAVTPAPVPSVVAEPLPGAIAAAPLPGDAEPVAPPAPGTTPVEPERESVRLPLDLTYYPAAELDAYPVPVRAIAFEFPEAPGGWVLVETSIGETGQVDEATVLDADPAGLLDAPALEALRRTRFQPARRDGREVRSRVLIELRVPDAAGAGER
jgi:periplasmic protein TonB